MKEFIKTEKTQDIHGRTFAIYKSKNASKQFVKYKGTYIPLTAFKKMETIVIEGGNVCPLSTLANVIYNRDRSAYFDPRKNFADCFLKGAFVFEDKDARLFQLISKCSSAYSPLWTSHQDVKERSSIKCSTYKHPIGAKFDTYCFNNRAKLYQYKVNLSPKAEISCNNHRSVKTTVLIYHFGTAGSIINGKPTMQREYTFIKYMEASYGALSKAVYGTTPKQQLKSVNTWGKHMIAETKNQAKQFLKPKSMFKLNMLPFPSQSKPSNDGITRYEDCVKKNNCNFTPTLPDQYHLKRLLQYDLPSNHREEILDGINFFTSHVRTGDEMFIPQIMTNTVLQSLVQ